MIPTDNMIITQDTKLSPGVYFLPHGIRLEGSNIALDGDGATLVGDNFTGTGIYCSYCDNLVLKNISIQGYYWGMKIENCSHLSISGCTIRSTHEIPANTIFLDIWTPVEKAYGAGIFLHHVVGGEISNNDLSHQMNGMLSYGCNNLEVRGNLANYCSGWGFHLNHTCNSHYENNYADYCCRYEPRGERKGHLGADSAGFLLINRSSDNKLVKNYARMGGDGFFLAGMTSEYEETGCNHNLFEENDGSFSPNNAFEATFSKGNIFRSNFANNSNYGFWLGFSRDGILENNQMTGNRQAGIAVENGINFDVSGNLFTK